MVEYSLSTRLDQHCLIIAGSREHGTYTLFLNLLRNGQLEATLDCAISWVTGWYCR